MANPSKAKGTAWESDIREYLQKHHDPDVRRNVQMGSKDIGDLSGYYLHALEAKAERTITLPEYIRQANKEAVNAGEPFGCAVVKRRNANVKDGYVVRNLATDVRLINRLRDAECLLEMHAPKAWTYHISRHEGLPEEEAA